MKISFLGAARTVTGSCFYIETDRYRFIVDCGLFQGGKEQDALNDEPFAFNPGELDFALLTHAHIDHSGRIPKLYVDGFKGTIYATKATTELAAIMLPDSGHIQEFENEWVNRKRERAGLPPVKPIYTQQDAENCMELFESVRYFEEVQINDQIRVRFNDAGHILGSSILELWVKEDDKEVKVVFTGDIGNNNMPILRDPTIIESADYLITESTYGNRTHMNVENKVERFVEIIISTMKKGGNIIIPSFAVGRTQEILYEIFKHREEYGDRLTQLMEIPVYVDSPLATSATMVFRNNLDCYDEEARSYIANGSNPLDFPGLHFTKTADESKALNASEGSKIIISASGMCDAGRIKHHLKHNLWRKDSSVVFVGYQAAGTLGRRLVDGAKKVRIFGEEITVESRIEMIEGFSGHADRDGILSWISKFSIKPRRIFLVHGEDEAIESFAGLIEENLNIETCIPGQGESFIVNEKGVFAAAGWKDARAATVVPYDYKRLQVVAMLDKIRDELEEASSILRDDLKKEKKDIEIEEMMKKLSKFERDLVELIR